VADKLVPVLFFGVRTLRGADRGARAGQGLALAKGLIEAMGGRISYEPVEGGGACFRLVVPVPNARLGGAARL
jgi:two-component system OmpR family sensor kinase